MLGARSEGLLNARGALRLERARERDATPGAAHKCGLGGPWPPLLLGPHAAPRSIGELPRSSRVREQGVECRRELRLKPDALDRGQHLDAMVEVTWHQIGAAEEHRRMVSGLEDEEPAVLEEATEDAAHANVLAHARHAGAERADAAHDEVDPRARFGRGVKRVDYFDMRETVCLHGDARLLAGARCTGDEADLFDEPL